jgi:SAM-dependent methyltransferase
MSEVSENSQVPWDGAAGGVPVRTGRHRADWRPASSAVTGSAVAGGAVAGSAVASRTVPGSAMAGGPVAGRAMVASRALKHSVLDHTVLDATVLDATVRDDTVRDEVAAARAWAEASLVTRSGCQYAGDRRRQPVALLQAGSAAVPGALDLAALRASCRELIVNAVDDDSPVTRAALGARPGPVLCALGDLRTVPLLPRSYDMVDCCLLLQRIPHAELVLDRLVEALKPGGLLLLRTGDRDCAAGFLDRVLPRWVRRAGWRFRRPGQPGPYPAVYEVLASERGIYSYVARRGLIIVRRQALSGPAAGRRPAGTLSARSVTEWLTRGRLTAAHDELVYVIRRPEDRSARLL